MKPQILIVDDEIILARAFQRIFQQRSPFDPIVENDPNNVLALLETTTPDLIFIDVVMPGLDGIELAMRIRSMPATAHIPIVLCTGCDDVDSSVGFPVLQKPVDIDNLLATAMSYLAAPVPQTDVVHADGWHAGV